MYDVNHYLNKFQNIPENLFCQKSHEGKKACYIGHCSYDESEGDEDEQSCLGYTILWEGMGFSAADLIYGRVEKYKHLSLKERIIAALNDYKDKELSEANVNAAKEIIEVEKIENILA